MDGAVVGRAASVVGFVFHGVSFAGTGGMGIIDIVVAIVLENESLGASSWW